MGQRFWIETGVWARADDPQRDMLRGLFGERAERWYELYFHWYNLVHELGHIIAICGALPRAHPAQEESLVNDFAVAFWRYYGEEEKLRELRVLVNEALKRFSAPLPDERGYMEWAKENWGSPAMGTFNNYGWFQFRCVSRALETDIGLPAAVHALSGRQIAPLREIRRYMVDGEMARCVLDDAVRIIHSWGVDFPETVALVWSDDVNCQRCRVE